MLSTDGVLPAYRPSIVTSAPDGVELKLHLTVSLIPAGVAATCPLFATAPEFGAAETRAAVVYAVGPVPADSGVTSVYSCFRTLPFVIHVIRENTALLSLRVETLPLR